eukprot:gene31229-biopygen6099
MSTESTVRQACLCDFLVLCINLAFINKAKAAIARLHKVRDLGDPACSVGYELTKDRNKGTIHSCQLRHVNDLLKLYNVTACSTLNALARPSSKPLQEHLDAAKGELRLKFQAFISAIGCETKPGCKAKPERKP